MSIVEQVHQAAYSEALKTPGRNYRMFTKNNETWTMLVVIFPEIKRELNMPKPAHIVRSQQNTILTYVI